MATISVIVPVYKVESYLKECIESILNQTYTDFELILVDDGSPDNCPQICDAYACADQRVVVVHKENGGLSSARNEGLANAKGKYVCFIDSDDYVDNQFLLKCITAIENSDSDIIRFGYKKITESNSILYYKEPNEYFYQHITLPEKLSFLNSVLLRYKVPVQAWSCFLKRDLLVANDVFFRENKLVFSEDVCFAIETVLIAKSTFVLPDPLYFFRKREGSIMWASKNAKDSHINEYNNMSKLIFDSYHNLFKNEDEFCVLHNSMLLIRLKSASCLKLHRQIKSIKEKDYFHLMNTLYYKKYKNTFVKMYGVYYGLVLRVLNHYLCNLNLFSYVVKKIILWLFVRPISLLRTKKR